MSKNIAIILAGGSGTRMGLEMPKQFLKVAGRTVLEHTVSVFHSHPSIDEIAIVGNKAYLNLVEELVLKNEWLKVKKVISGGKERYDSSLAGINLYEKEGEDVNLIFHDVVSPLVNHRIITDNIIALGKCNAVNTVVPSTNTIIELEDNLLYIKSIPDRAYLWQGQSPQSFKLGIIKRAYDLALKDSNFKSTDDCGVVKKYLPNEKILAVKGDEQNIKITYNEDLQTLKNYL